MNPLKRLLGSWLLAALILAAPGLLSYQALASNIVNPAAATDPAAAAGGITGAAAATGLSVPAAPVSALGRGLPINAAIQQALPQDIPSLPGLDSSAASPEPSLESQASLPSADPGSSPAVEAPAGLASAAPAAQVPTRRTAVQEAVASLKRYFGASRPDTPEDVYEEAQRPPRLIARDEEGRFTIANIRWGRKDADSHYWDSARIDPQAVEEAYWGNIEGGVGHSFLVFRFKDGGLTSSREGAPPAKFLAVSVEARLKKGQTYNPIAGEFGAYPSQVWNLYTLEDWTQDTLGEEHRPFALYPLLLSALQKETLATLAISKSLLDHSADPYNSLRNNCATNSLALYDAVVTAARRVRGFLLALPALATRALVKAGAVGPGVRFTSQDRSGGGLIPPPGTK